MRFINYLNLHRCRLGYVNCVLLIADMQLDSSQSLRRRLDQRLFDNVVYRDSPLFGEFSQLVDDSAMREIGKRAARRGLRKSKRPRQGVIEGQVFDSLTNRDNDEVDRFLKEVYSPSDLWLFQRTMRSHLGVVIREYSGEPIELAKDLGFLSDGYALTEFGNIGSLLLSDRITAFRQPLPEPNPLGIYEDIRLRLLYLYALLRTDIVFAYLLESLSRGLNTHEVLRASLERLLGELEENTRLDEISQFKGILELKNRIKKVPVEKTQRVPRLEFCVDLGLLERVEAAKTEGRPSGRTANADDGAYKTTPFIERVPSALSGLLEKPNRVDKWLDQNFFNAASILYDRTLIPVSDANTRLVYFVKGANFIGRKMGFIPGRIASMIGCLLAWVDGYLVEIADLFEDVYAVPKGKWAGHIKFSGGSRLDAEFLVAIEPGLLAKLEEARSKSS